MTETFFSIMLEKLLDENRKPDGSRYSYKEIYAGTGNAVSAEYVRQLHQGLADNPGYNVIEALSAFFGVSPSQFFLQINPMKDRHYRQIIVGLSTIKNYDLFEKCVIDLLKDDFPGMVPIPGGSDMGMDGAFPDGEDAYCPVVVTAGKDIVGNLERNLNSYIDNGLPSRKAIFITSNPLNQQQRKRLLEKANELGFQLIAPPFDKVAIADRLYRNPKWCKELLGITGTPPILSKVPLGTGLFPDIDPVAREKELDWLKNNTGDRILVGEPGVGKTFLLRKLAQEDLGLFVIGSNLTDIANDLREMEPKILMIEDAHFKEKFLGEIQQLRIELGADFSILVSCWPEYEKEIAQMLQIPGENILKLDRLTRMEMIKVIQAMGMNGPVEHIAFTLDQVDGRPGLAAILMADYLRGDYEQLNSGRTITNAILRFVKKDERDDARIVLAAFSLGGEGGLKKKTVETQLGMSAAEIWKLVSKLANSGIVHVFGDYVSVRPQIMRYALVRDVFFSQNPLGTGELISAASNKNELALTLIGARARGGKISDDLIISVLEYCSSDIPWKEFARLGTRETMWVLSNHPERLLAIASVALEKAPDITISLLLEKAEGDNRVLSASPGHPLRILGTWIQASRPGTESAIFRRKNLMKSTTTWFYEKNNSQVGLQAMRLALSPLYEDKVWDPVEINKVHLLSGALTIDEMTEVISWFEESIDMIMGLPLEFSEWEIIFRMIEDWAYPGRIRGSIPDKTYNLMRDAAKKLIEPLLTKAVDNFGIRLQFKNILSHLGSNSEVQIPKEFELLYGEEISEELEDWKAMEASREKEIKSLGKELAEEAPIIVGEELKRYEKEAKMSNHGYPNRMPLLVKYIAEYVDNPNKWSIEWKLLGFERVYLVPFFEKWMEKELAEFENFAKQHIDDPEIGVYLQWMFLRREDTSDEILDQVIDAIEKDEDSIHQILLWRQISDKAMKRLLTHPNSKISGLVAITEWSMEPRGIIRENFGEDWIKAMGGLNVSDIESSFLRNEFKRGLQSNPALAAEWLEKQLKNEETEYFSSRDLFVEVSSVLNIDQRQKLIQCLPDSYFARDLATALVGNDVQAYQELLTMPDLENFYSAPLSRNPDESWFEMAKLAREKGISAYEISQELIYPNGIADAHASAWLEKVQIFERLIDHPEKTISEIGEQGKVYCQNRYEKALEENRYEQIYGRR